MSSYARAFCPKHGPYDAHQPGCPYCARETTRAGGVPGTAPGTMPGTMPGAMPDTAPDAVPNAMRDAMPDAASDVRVPLAFLIVSEPLAQRGTVYTLRAADTRGRAPVILPDEASLVRQHARFAFEAAPDDPAGGWFTVQSVDAAPGTQPGLRLNGAAIATATPLHENDELQLAHTTFVVKTLI